MQNKLFCFGLGYVARYLANELILKNWQISGTTRSSEKQNNLQNLGFKIHLDNLENNKNEIINDLQDTTHIIMSVPPKEGEDLIFKNYKNIIEKLPNLKWIGYLSTTGVYGDYQGGWVNEESELRAKNSRNIARINAEKQWLSTKLPIHIFRLSGIYGPDRNILLDLKNNKANIIKKENQFFSRIHVEDIVQILIASMNNIAAYNIYNLADNLPSSKEEIVTYAANLLNIPLPKAIDLEDANISKMAKSFYESSRKTSNDKIKTKLKVKLKYPTYKEALQALLPIIR